MRITTTPPFLLLLLPFLTSIPTLTSASSNHLRNAAPLPRSLAAVLVEAPPQEPTPTPHINHLDLRQVAAGVGGAGNVAAPAQPPAAAGAAPAVPAAAAPPAAAAGADAVDPTASPTVAIGGAASATAVKSGAVGMGTLTGQVGVVNGKDAKNGAGRGEVWGVVGWWVVGGVVGGGWMGFGG